LSLVAPGRFRRECRPRQPYIASICSLAPSCEQPRLVRYVIRATFRSRHNTMPANRSAGRDIHIYNPDDDAVRERDRRRVVMGKRAVGAAYGSWAGFEAAHTLRHNSRCSSPLPTTQPLRPLPFTELLFLRRLVVGLSFPLCFAESILSLGNPRITHSLTAVPQLALARRPYEPCC
jgi:hypothetical protein